MFGVLLSLHLNVVNLIRCNIISQFANCVVGEAIRKYGG